MMKRVMALLIVMAFLFSAIAVAEGKLKAVDKNLIVFAGDDTGYFYAKIENIGDMAIGVDTGDFVAFSEDDEIVLSDSYIMTLPSRVVLEPGDYLYAREFLWDSALENAEIVDYKFSVSTREQATAITRIPCEATFELPGVDSYDNYIYVTFTNPTEESLYDCYVTAALYDADGSLVFVDSSSLSAVGLHGGSTITVKLYVDNDLMEHYKANGIVPTTVDAMVCYPTE